MCNCVGMMMTFQKTNLSDIKLGILNSWWCVHDRKASFDHPPFSQNMNVSKNKFTSQFVTYEVYSIRFQQACSKWCPPGGRSREALLAGRPPSPRGGREVMRRRTVSADGLLAGRGLVAPEVRLSILLLCPPTRCVAASRRRGPSEAGISAT